MGEKDLMDGLFSQFRQAATAVEAQVQLVAGMAEVLERAVEIVTAAGGTTIAAPGLDSRWRQKLAALCQGAGLTLITRDLRAYGAGFHAGLSLALWGVAETGTLIFDSTNEDLRLASMLGEIHLAALPLAAIYPTGESLVSELESLVQTPPRYLAFVTGASRTADIERVLTIGVHGPKRLHIMVMHEYK